MLGAFLLTLMFAASVTAAAPATSFPWSETLPDALVRDAVAPDTVAYETPCDWRPLVTPMAQELVKNCTSAREAVLALATGLPKASGVHYSIERSKHNMNAIEALTEKKVSCTGQSVFLVCALRSVGIPARMVGVLTWNHVRGNHSWVEAWFENEWHMIEYAEQDFNTPWVMENIGMLDSHQPEQRIQALTPSGREPFLAAYAMNRVVVPAENVSERYAALARDYYARNGAGADVQRVMVDVAERASHAVSVVLVDEAGKTVSSDYLPTSRDDVRRFACLNLPRHGQFYLRIGDEAEQRPLRATPAPVQILRLER